ncbi:hypothetical protein [Streptomyces erythrochromogenes]|uniref:hypothetical protein n=1 Tax=Streptomyces erythrochromogenes TaxID=285574 RepID=UPI0036797D85
MTAWQYFAGAGLVAALCPLHGHVAVAGDGPGRGARVDLCVPAPGAKGPGAPPSGRPSVRVAVPGADAGLTVRHPGWTHRPGRPAAVVPPGPSEPSAAGPAQPSGEAEAVAAPAEPPPPAPGPGEAAGPGPAEASAPPPPRAAAAPVSAFHVRPYRAVAVQRTGPGGMSTVMLMVVVTTPAVLAAAALRPRSKGRG